MGKEKGGTEPPPPSGNERTNAVSPAGLGTKSRQSTWFSDLFPFLCQKAAGSLMGLGGVAVAQDRGLGVGGTFAFVFCIILQRIEGRIEG